MSHLVVLAAGLGSRFGGTKQLEEVGPNGEAFCDFAIADARAAGIDRVVMVIRTDLDDAVRGHLEARHGADAPIRYVFQDRHEGLGAPPRRKPWGTVHAVLSAADEVSGGCVVVNADDYYGPSSYATAADALAEVGDEGAALVAFRLGRTVPDEGSVSRGVCEVADGRLVGIAEHHGVRRTVDGLRSDEGPLAEDTPVSLNLWCLGPAVLDGLRGRWDAFLAAHRDDETAECLLPNEIGALMDAGLEVVVRESSEEWIGVTNPDDLEIARRRLAARR